MSYCDEEFPFLVSSFDSYTTTFNISRHWEGKCLDNEEKSGDDELALYASFNDTEQGPPFTSTRKRLGMFYSFPVFCSCSECSRKFYYSIPAALAEVSVVYVSKSKALLILRQSVGDIAPESL